MRIRVWSSDVCSSDLCGDRRAYHAVDVAVGAPGGATPMTLMIILGGIAALYLTGLLFRLAFLALPVYLGLCAFLLLRDQGNGWAAAQIGRASCRERVCQYV